MIQSHRRTLFLSCRNISRAFSTSPAHFKVIPEATQTSPGKRPAEMDTLKSNKGVDEGSRAAEMHVDPADGVHERAPKASNDGVGADSKGIPAMNKDGAIGSMFKSDGAIGSVADKVGGPFSKDGTIGKNFEADGAVGGTVHDNLGKK